MKVLLTSCGLETTAIISKFLELLGKDASGAKALFIPTAAIDADAIYVLPKCMDDLLKRGIAKQNITVYDLHRPMSKDELERYDVVYICGGNTEHLLCRINEHGFNKVLLNYIDNNGLVIGVSAGSVIFAGNLNDNLGLIKQPLDVHCAENDCERAGALDAGRAGRLKLGNLQAIVIEDDSRYIIG